MNSDLKIQIKRVGNGYLVSKNFNEEVELIRDYEPGAYIGPDRGVAHSEIQQFLQVAACVIDFLGHPEIASGLCSRVVPEATPSAPPIEYYETVHGDTLYREQTNESDLELIERLAGIIRSRSTQQQAACSQSMSHTAEDAADGFMYECSKCLHQWVYAGAAIHPVCPECKSKKTAPADLG